MIQEINKPIYFSYLAIKLTLVQIKGTNNFSLQTHFNSSFKRYFNLMGQKVSNILYIIVTITKVWFVLFNLLWWIFKINKANGLCI